MKETDKWDARFLKIAYEVSTWSKDPGTRVGAVLVQDRRVIATGYNGFPQGISDSLERYADRETKLAFTVHAEVNAILNAAKNGAETGKATLYVTFPPCVRCATSIIQAGITRLICPSLDSSPERWRSSFEDGQLLLNEAKIQVKFFDPNKNGFC